MKCVIRRAEKVREYFCSLWDGQAIRVKPRDQPDIEKQHEGVSERKRGSENDECARKRLRYRKTFVWGKWISRLLRCAHRGNFYWFSVRSDSQRSFRAPVSHPHLLTLTFPPSDHSLLSPSFFIHSRVRSRFLLLFTDISAERVSCITAPLSFASPPLSSCSFLSPHRGDLSIS